MVKMETVRRANAAILKHQHRVNAGLPQQIGESIQHTTLPCPCSESAGDKVKLYRNAGIPKRHDGKVNDGLCPQEWIAKRDVVIRQIGSGCMLGLIGPRGTGKTQIAQQAAVYCAGLNRPSLYVRAMTLFLELRATYRSETVTELSVIDKYRTPSLLVIDEMQERGESEWENRTLTHLLDLRYGDMTDTILIANLKPRELQASLGDSISDRLRETGGIIECDWASFRVAGGVAAKAMVPA